jgi:hypothetical protein
MGSVNATESCGLTALACRGSKNRFQELNPNLTSHLSASLCLIAGSNANKIFLRGWRKNVTAHAVFRYALGMSGSQFRFRMNTSPLRYPAFQAEVYAPYLDNPGYPVVIGSHLTQADAKMLRDRAVNAGLTKQTYYKTFPSFSPS